MAANVKRKRSGLRVNPVRTSVPNDIVVALLPQAPGASFDDPLPNSSEGTWWSVGQARPSDDGRGTAPARSIGILDRTVLANAVLLFLVEQVRGALYIELRARLWTRELDIDFESLRARR